MFFTVAIVGVDAITGGLRVGYARRPALTWRLRRASDSSDVMYQRSDRGVERYDRARLK